jgi:hypothetical protein
MKYFAHAIISLMSLKAICAEPVNHWTLDQSTFSSFATNYSAQVQNTSFVPGMYSDSIQFNGGNSILVVQNDNINFGVQTSTISLWIRPKQQESSRIIFNKKGADIPEVNSGYQLRTTNRAESWSISTSFTNSGNSVGCNNCGSSYSYNSWYNIVLKYTGDSFEVYVNGLLDSSIPSAGVNLSNNDSELHIGGTIIQNGPTEVIVNSFNGDIDDIRTYNTSLSAQEIHDQYQEGRNVITPSRLGAYTKQAPDGSLYTKDVVYQAPSDGFIVFFTSGNYCNDNDYIFYVRRPSEAEETTIGRMREYNTSTIPVGKGDYWRALHHVKKSGCILNINFRPLGGS